MGRDIPTPFHMQIKNGESEEWIEITEILRIVPGKRITAISLWREKLVIVKLFFHPVNWKRNHVNDVRGIKLLMDKDLRTPAILKDTCTKDNRGAVLIMQYLEQGITLNSLIESARTEIEKYHVIELAISAIADCHKKGILQEDIHLDNFFCFNECIYFLDGGNVKAADNVLLEKHALTNLAVFFAQLNITLDRNIFSLLENYEKRVYPISKSARTTFIKRVKNARANRLNYIEKKLFRSTTAHRNFRTRKKFVVYDRKLQSNEFKNLIRNPESYVNEAKIIKAGNASTVMALSLDNIGYVLKKYNLKTFWHSIKYLFKPSRAAYSWRNASVLEVIGINTPHPYFFYEERLLWIFRRRAFFLSEKIEAPHLLDFMNSGELIPSEIENIITSFKEFFEIMVYYQISHGDMKATNFIFHNRKLFVLDLDAMKRYRSRNLYNKAIRKDLDRFMRNWHGERFESDFEKLIKSIELPM